MFRTKSQLTDGFSKEDHLIEDLFDGFEAARAALGAIKETIDAAEWCLSIAVASHIVANETPPAERATV